MPKYRLEPNMVKKGTRFYYRLPRERGRPERTRPLGNDIHAAREEARTLNRDRGLHVGTPTVEEFALKTWIPGRVALRRSDTNKKLAEQRFRDYIAPVIGAKLPRMVTTADVDAIHAALRKHGLAVRTIRHVLSDGRALFRALERAGHVDGQPFRADEFPRAPKALPRPLPDTTLADIRKRVPPHFRDQVLAALFTGLRYGELRALEREDVDLGTNPAVLVWKSHDLLKTKGGEPRRVPLFPEAVALFRRLVEAKHEGRHVLTAQRGGRLPEKPNRVDKALTEMFPGVSFHRLRHTFATRCRRAGMSWPDLQHVLGHADVRTTMQYALVEDGPVAERVREIRPDFFGARVGKNGEAVGKEPSAPLLAVVGNATVRES